MSGTWENSASDLQLLGRPHNTGYGAFVLGLGWAAERSLPREIFGTGALRGSPYGVYPRVAGAGGLVALALADHLTVRRRQVEAIGAGGANSELCAPSRGGHGDETCIEYDLGACERLRHRAAGLRRLRRPLDLGLVDPWNLCLRFELDPRDFAVPIHHSARAELLLRSLVQAEFLCDSGTAGLALPTKAVDCFTVGAGRWSSVRLTG